MQNQKTQQEYNLLKELGIENMSKEVRQEFLNKFGEAVMSAVTTKALNELSSENQEKLREMIDDKTSEDDISAFLQERVNNFEQITQQAARKTLEELQHIKRRQADKVQDEEQKEQAMEIVDNDIKEPRPTNDFFNN